MDGISLEKGINNEGENAQPVEILHSEKIISIEEFIDLDLITEFVKIPRLHKQYLSSLVRGMYVKQTTRRDFTGYAVFAETLEEAQQQLNVAEYLKRQNPQAVPSGDRSFRGGNEYRILATQTNFHLGKQTGSGENLVVPLEFDSSFFSLGIQILNKRKALPHRFQYSLNNLAILLRGTTPEKWIRIREQDLGSCLEYTIIAWIALHTVPEPHFGSIEMSFPVVSRWVTSKRKIQYHYSLAFFLRQKDDSYKFYIHDNRGVYNSDSIGRLERDSVIMADIVFQWAQNDLINSILPELDEETRAKYIKSIVDFHTALIAAIKRTQDAKRAEKAENRLRTLNLDAPEA